MPTINWGAEGLMLAQGARRVIYKSLALESALAVSDLVSKGGKRGGVGIQLGVIRAELVKTFLNYHYVPRYVICGLKHTLLIGD